MPRFDVHIYAIARLKVTGIEADSAQEAVQIAEQVIDLHQAIASGDAEYADEIVGFLVDALNDAGVRIEGDSVVFNPTVQSQSTPQAPASVGA
jgi:hypothetical protein